MQLEGNQWEVEDGSSHDEQRNVKVEHVWLVNDWYYYETNRCQQHKDGNPNRTLQSMNMEIPIGHYKSTNMKISIGQYKLTS